MVRQMIAAPSNSEAHKRPNRLRPQFFAMTIQKEFLDSGEIARTGSDVYALISPDERAIRLISVRHRDLLVVAAASSRMPPMRRRALQRSGRRTRSASGSVDRNNALETRLSESLSVDRLS